MENTKNLYEIKYKQTNKMAELKGLWAFLNILGYTTYVYALFVSFANVDVFTRTVLGFVGLVFLVAKLIVFCVSSMRKHRIENLDIREKEVAIKEREAALYEKETAIIKEYKLK
jgi:hypothetical protein